MFNINQYVIDRQPSVRPLCDAPSNSFNLAPSKNGKEFKKCKQSKHYNRGDWIITIVGIYENSGQGAGAAAGGRARRERIGGDAAGAARHCFCLYTTGLQIRTGSHGFMTDVRSRLVSVASERNRKDFTKFASVVLFAIMITDRQRSISVTGPGHLCADYRRSWLRMQRFDYGN